MTYFPQPDPERLRQAMSRQASFLQTPPSSAALQKADDEWAIGTSSEGLMPITAAHTWPASEHHGLGLLSVPTTTTSMDQIYQDAITAAQSMTMPFPWPSELAASPAPSSRRSHHLRAESWSGSCNPLSTLLPAETLWDPLQQPSSSSAAVYDASPSISSYSTCSQASAMSSPYAHSEAYTRGRSPMIKLEDPFERLTPPVHVLPETVPLEQSLLVNPGDLVTQPPASMSKRVTTSSFPSFGTSPMPDEEDVKHPALQHRPAYRKAFSSENVRRELPEDRRKRGYTKPENASCSCDKCGKLFQRSYNLKAHMETHDPERSQPHVCPYPVCEKRFVRRTDLLRHEQSVHLKSRNYPCPLCGSCFARKDTLRRHVDDGCPKRPEVKRRATKIRHPSNASSTRRSS